MNNSKKFWFVVGSQELYGDEALSQVKENAQNCNRWIEFRRRFTI
jgi:L-arabinose isomerase